MTHAGLTHRWVVKHQRGWQLPAEGPLKGLADLHGAQGVQACRHERLVWGHRGAQDSLDGGLDHRLRREGRVGARWGVSQQEKGVPVAARAATTTMLG